MIVDGFFDWAERMPGPANKVWPDTNSNEAVVFHSAVGSLQGVINVVFRPFNPGDETTKRSVTGVVGYDGGFVQFYPVTASPWANGSYEFNQRYLGFEFEGGADTPETVSEPLTTAQVDAAVHILRDLAGWKNVSPTYWERPWTLKEHRELVATSCPSGRIPWDVILAALKPGPVAPDKLLDLTFLVDVGYFITHDWDFTAMQPWQKELMADWNRRANG